MQTNKAVWVSSMANCATLKLNGEHYVDLKRVLSRKFSVFQIKRGVRKSVRFKGDTKTDRPREETVINQSN